VLDRFVSAGSKFADRFTKSTPTVGPKEPRAVEESAQQASVIDNFLNRLTIAPIRNSRLVDIKFQLTDREVAASIANALAKAYIDQNLEFKGLASKEATDWLTTQLEQQRKQVEDSEAKLQRYRVQTEAVSTNQRENLGIQKLAELNSALTRAKTERIQREAAFRQIQAVQDDYAALSSWPTVLANANVQSAKAELTQLQRQESQLSGTLGERHPEMVKLRSALATAEARLKTEIQKVVTAAENDAISARAIEDSYVQAVELQKREGLAMRGKEAEFAALERNAFSDRQIFESLLQRTKETGVTGEVPSNNIRIIDEADIPRTPVSPRKGRNMLIAFLTGSFMAIGMALFAEYLDKGIKTPDQIKQQLGLACLGMVPVAVRDESGEAQLVSSETVSRHFKEAFRTVRTNLLFVSDDEQQRTVLVTSTGPNEGKTIIASNLAVALAQARQRVLLIDADMRRPRVHEIFEVPLQPGLSELIRGEHGELIRPSGTPGLSLLPAGEVPADPAELLSSREFHRVLKKFGEQFDWVLIDTPPVMAVSDAALVAHVSAGVLFVIGAEQTTVPAALNALEQLEAANARFVGAVLNRVELERNSFFYSDYYRPEYQKYYMAPKPQPEPEQPAAAQEVNYGLRGKH
jgi:capsular exopolysaccharide synthesis family protein